MALAILLPVVGLLGGISLLLMQRLPQELVTMDLGDTTLGLGDVQLVWLVLSIGIATTLGIAAGCMVWAIASAAGVAAVLAAQVEQAATDALAKLIPNAPNFSLTVKEAIEQIPGLTPLDERLVGRAGIAAWDPLRLSIDVRGTGMSGYDLARRVREHGARELLRFGRPADPARRGGSGCLDPHGREVRRRGGARGGVRPDPPRGARASATERVAGRSR